MHCRTGLPHVLDGVIDSTTPADDVVEEGLRLVPPIPAWRRVAQRDVVMEGVRVPKGRRVILWLARARR
jgi:cytochrome P450